MRIIAILICLVLERYLSFGPAIRYYHWFDGYTAFLHKLLAKTSIWKSWTGLLIVMVPIIIVVCVVNWIIYDWVFGLIGLLYAVIVFLYCLGPEDLYNQYSAYKSAKERGDNEEAARLYQALTDKELGSDNADAEKTLGDALLSKTVKRLFGPIFWFMIFGVAGAVLYRFIVLLKDQAAQGESSSVHEQLTAADTAQKILDWLPVRLVTLSYLLIGNFFDGFKYWLSNLWGGLNSNQDMLLDCGRAALSMKSEKAAADANRSMSLIDRAAVIWIIVLAVGTFASWVF